MNSKILTLLLCFILNLAWGGDTIVSFHRSKITLPQGYIELTKDQSSSFQSSTQFNHKIMSVYAKIDLDLGAQTIVLYYDTIRGIKNLKFDKILQLKLETIEESGIVFSNIKIDTFNHYVFGKTVLNGDTSLFVFSVDLNGIMGIQFNNSIGISNSDIAIFENIIQSIKHDSPYQFIPEENPRAKEAKKNMEDSGVKLTIGLIIMILVWLGRKYLVKKKQEE